MGVWLTLNVMESAIAIQRLKFEHSYLLLQVPSSFPYTNKHWYADIQMIQKLLMGTVMGVNIMHWMTVMDDAKSLACVRDLDQKVKLF